MKKETPILFSTLMILAILAGRKTMTRRIIKPQPIIDNDSGYVFDGNHHFAANIHNWKETFTDHFSRWMRDDLIWVKETFYAYGHWTSITDTNTSKTEWTFRDLTIIKNLKHQYADNPPEKVYRRNDRKLGWYKRPSLFMPKEAARIWLEVTDIKVERLQDISEEDAIAEGVDKHPYNGMKGWEYRYKNYQHTTSAVLYAKNSFSTLWRSINGGESWGANPWVWVVSFKVLSTVGKPDSLNSETKAYAL